MRTLLGKLLCAVGWVFGLFCVLVGVAVIFIAACCVVCLVVVPAITAYILCKIGRLTSGKREAGK